MDKGKIFIDLVEANDIVVQAMWNERTNEITQREGKEFERGALWGMAWAMNNIWAYVTKFSAPEQYSQEHCGESSIDHTILNAADRLAAMRENSASGRMI